MSLFLRGVALFLLTTTLLGCAGSGAGSGSGAGTGTRGGLHFPRPGLDAHGATIAGGAASVEILTRNPTDAPLWIRRLEVTLSAEGAALASGQWEGDRLIDPGTSVLLDLSLPLIEGAARPGPEVPGRLTVTTRYARSGLLGLLGGESFTYELPVAIEFAD